MVRLNHVSLILQDCHGEHSWNGTISFAARTLSDVVFQWCRRGKQKEEISRIRAVRNLPGWQSDNLTVPRY